jgi:hypothetical protein
MKTTLAHLLPTALAPMARAQEAAPIASSASAS